MKRASYRAAVAHVAMNDNPGDNESVEVLTGYLTVVLISELFGVTSERVARDVMRVREQEGLLACEACGEHKPLDRDGLCKRCAKLSTH